MLWRAICCLRHLTRLTAFSGVVGGLVGEPPLEPPLPLHEARLPASLKRLQIFSGALGREQLARLLQYVL